MEQAAHTPKTLVEAIRHFADPDVCLQLVAELRWDDGPECPKCSSKEYSFLKTRRVWKCKSCKKQYSVKQGTIFEDSPLSLDKWLVVIWMLANCKNGVSSYEIARDLGVTQKSAWFMLQRIRTAMQSGTFRKLSGEIEADETFIGGKAKNMHKAEREARIQGRGVIGKAIVMGVLERHGEVRASVIPTRRKKQVQGEVRKHVEPGSRVYTDELLSYEGLNDEFFHEFINHTEAYVDGAVHTNGMENFWSLLKRGLAGTYVSVEPYHLSRYVDEQAFRFNNRKVTDSDRFRLVLAGIKGKRLTYAEVTGG